MVYWFRGYLIVIRKETKQLPRYILLFAKYYRSFKAEKNCMDASKLEKIICFLSYFPFFKITRAGMAMNTLTVYDIQNKFIGTYQRKIICLVSYL